MAAISTRINERVEKIPIAGCWIWMGGVTYGGYGVMSHKGKSNLAHRLSYTAYKGEIPKGFDIDHLCRVRSCVNPEHLEAVTRKENIRRGQTGCKTVGRKDFGDVAKKFYAAKTHCKNGHEYTSETIYSARNHRECKICRKECVKKHQLKLKGD
jgi:HNH endonuclease